MGPGVAGTGTATQPPKPQEDMAIRQANRIELFIGKIDRRAGERKVA
jgi:hypothetical protein